MAVKGAMMLVLQTTYHLNAGRTKLTSSRDIHIPMIAIRPSRYENLTNGLPASVYSKENFLSFISRDTHSSFIENFEKLFHNSLSETCLLYTELLLQASRKMGLS